MVVENELKRYTELAESAVAKYSVSYECRQKKLFDAVNYSLLAGGKRLRPVILLAMCEAAGGNCADAEAFAAGLEMIHNSSLIHDDLPAMDDDDLRRGRPTNHKVYGEATAILAGDVLLVRPFEIMADNAATPGQVKAMSVIARAAGQEGMMGGQQVDIECEGRHASEETIIYLNTLKTGALFRAACNAGVLIAGGSEAMLRAADEYGRMLGLAFQLVDDLLDNNAEADTGKTKGSDIAAGKSTYLSAYGEERCRGMVDECTQRAAAALSPFGERAEFLKELVIMLKDRLR